MIEPSPSGAEGQGILAGAVHVRTRSKGRIAGILLDDGKGETSPPSRITGGEGKDHPVRGHRGRARHVGEQRPVMRGSLGGRKRCGDILRGHGRAVRKNRVGADRGHRLQGIGIVQGGRETEPGCVIGPDRRQSLIQQGGEVEIGPALSLIGMK